jgi:hypothetical protein
LMKSNPDMWTLERATVFVQNTPHQPDEFAADTPAYAYPNFVFLGL